MKVEIWPVERLIPYDKNPRIAPAAAIAMLAEGITEFGFRNPVQADKDGVIIAGHTRLMAAKKAGLKEVPVIVHADMSPAQAAALRIADNKLAELTDWSPDLLVAELKMLDVVGQGWEGLGFTDEELAKLLGDPEATLGAAEAKIKLADRFGVPPFSVLNAREGWWQDRKRAWIALGIQSELGRGENAGAKLTMSASIPEFKPSADQAAKNSKAAQNGAVPGGAAKRQFTEKAPASNMRTRNE